MLKNKYNPAVMIILTLIAFSATSLMGKTQIYTVNGFVQKVTEDTQTIYIKSDKRVTAFKASKELCYQYKDKLNKEVIVKYTKEKDKSLKIKTMNLKPAKKA